MRLFLTLFFLLVVSSCCGGEHRQRIEDLLPGNTLINLAINPAIPEDFVAINPSEKFAFEWIYWGPKEVLEAYFKDPYSLSRSIIRVKLGEGTQQQVESPNYKEECECLLKRLGFRNFKDIHLNWGDYPVYGIRATSSQEVFFTALVGLNDPAGWIMHFQLLYPCSRYKPTIADLKLWESLLIETKQLNEEETRSLKWNQPRTE